MRPLWIGVLAALGFFAHQPLHAADCGALASLKVPGAAIEGAQPIAAGRFAPPYGKMLDGLPAFCRVAGIARPSGDSEVRFEVWLPESGWNGRFLVVGNGGFAGTIGYEGMAGVLKRGYATAATDTGHQAQSEDASWAFGHPERVKDFGWRGLHVTVEDAKLVLSAYYGKHAEHSYFDACSDGGREALMEAQRFPEDFDGILAGAPAYNWTALLGSGLDVGRAMFLNPAAYISAMKTPAITAKVLSMCDAQDGVRDGFINNPEACHFEPQVMQCAHGDALSCLTAPQVVWLKKLYAGGTDAKGKPIFPGMTPGSEYPLWDNWVLGEGPGGSSGITYVSNFFRYMVYQDPTWNPLTADVDASLRAAEEKVGEDLNATNPNLAPFQARGGKLILYHGWNDPAISPRGTILYYEDVQQSMGKAKAAAFVSLYMAPGMGHCFDGTGPNAFGQLGIPAGKGPRYGIFTALEDWVEKGRRPESIVATRYADDVGGAVKMTRPLCPYPQIAKYKGSGDTNNSDNFTCVAP